MPLADGFDAAEREDWLALVDKTLKGAPFEKTLTRKLREGIVTQPIYSEADRPDVMPPPLDGVRAAARVRDGWNIRQLHAYPEPEETNRLIRDELARGVDEVTIRLDDPDGEIGVIIRTLDDLDRTLAGVDLSAVPVHLAPGADFAGAAGLMRALEARRGEISIGGLGVDPLGALARTGALPGSIEGALAALATIAGEASGGRSRAVSVDTSTYHEAGADEADDLAIMLATGVAYLRSMEGVGLDLASALGQIEVSMAVGVDVFPAIAKLRAARRLWARVAEASGANSADQILHLHVVTARNAISTRDAWINMLRATVSCFAGAVGGADGITVLPYGEAVGLPDGFARRIARNTQLVLKEESSLARVLDPAAGSYYVETLTDALAQEAWVRFQAIEAAGGMVEWLVSGRLSERLAEGWTARELDIARRREPLTGISEFPNIAEKSVDVIEVDIETLRAGPTGDLMDLSIAGVAGEPARIDPPTRHRLAEGFETLRQQSDAVLAKRGARPKAMLANLGTAADYTARSTFAKNYLEAGGIETVAVEASPESVAEAFAASGAGLAVICSSDTLYDNQAEPVARALRDAGALSVVLAGRPGAREERFRAAGIERFVYMGDDTLATLRGLVALLGGVET
ncbi:MAG: methylmalonyl-CoA mutase small subunit [Rhodospirillaceae bacterium]|nr:methylmalonyl-CoA mutase small subunit [Rhodospirillaceae bacterium]